MVFLAYIFMARQYERYPRSIYSLLSRPLPSYKRGYRRVHSHCSLSVFLSLYMHYHAKAIYEAAIKLSVYERTILKLKEAARSVIGDIVIA